MHKTQIRPIINYRDSSRLLKCEPIKSDDEFETYVKILLTNMKYHGVAGLSAPQIGIPVQLIGMYFDEFIFFANPKWEAVSSKWEQYDEECLSVTVGDYGKLLYNTSVPIKKRRPIKIRVTRSEFDLESGSFVFEGVNAANFIHLYEHLHGVEAVETLSKNNKKRKVIENVPFEDKYDDLVKILESVETDELHIVQQFPMCSCGENSALWMIKDNSNVISTMCMECYDSEKVPTYTLALFDELNEIKGDEVA